MKFAKGTAYVGIQAGRLYVGWQYNLPLRRVLLRFRRQGRHVWIGPLYVILS